MAVDVGALGLDAEDDARRRYKEWRDGLSDYEKTIADNGGIGAKQAADYEHQRAATAAAIPTKRPDVDYSAADHWVGENAAARNQSRSALGALQSATDLERRASEGQAPSAAAYQSRIAQGQSLQNQFAAAAQGRGAQRNQAASMAALQGAALGQQIGAQSAAQRAQEISTARQGYIAGAGQTAMRNLVATGQSQQDEATGLRRAQYLSDLEMRQRELNAAREQSYVGSELAWLNREGQVQLAAQAQSDRERAETDAETRQIIASGLSGAANFGVRAAGPTNSDERGKTAKSERGVDALLSALAKSSSTYRYKDESMQPTSEPKGPDQRFAGVMAQDLERVPEIGHALVSEGPRGKVVENGAALSALLAAVGRQQQQIDALKGGRRGG